MKAYTPISCNTYDQLEAIAVLRKTVELVYKDARLGTQTLKTQIKDLQTVDKVEYLITANQLKIRLDHLIRIDGNEVGESCAIY